MADLCGAREPFYEPPEVAACPELVGVVTVEDELLLDDPVPEEPVLAVPLLVDPVPEVVGALVVAAVEGVALAVALGVVVAALAEAEADGVAVAAAEAEAVGVTVAVLTLAAALALRAASVSWRANTARPPAPMVAKAASPAVMAVTWRRPVRRMLMSATLGAAAVRRLWSAGEVAMGPAYVRCRAPDTVPK